MSHSDQAGQSRFHQFLLSRELGGAGLVGLGLAERLLARGDRVRLWVPGPGAAESAARKRALPVSRYLLRHMGRGKVFQALGCLGMAVRRGGRATGIAHLYSPHAYRLLTPALRLVGLKTVLHLQIEHGRDELRWAFQTPPDMMVTCAEYMVPMVRGVLSEGRVPVPVTAVPNSVDTQRYCPGDRTAAKRAVGAPQGVPLVLMLANLSPHKGQITAVRAVARLKAQGTRVECWLGGVERDGQRSFTGRLRSAIDRLGVADRVRLLGFRSDTPELLRAADVVRLPSTCEGLPLSRLEARATKVPVIAAPTAGIPEIIQDGRTGYLVAADDAAGYAQRIRQLLDEPLLAGKIAEHAYAGIRQRHLWTSFAGRVMELYARRLSRSGNRTSVLTAPATRIGWRRRPGDAA